MSECYVVQIDGFVDLEGDPERVFEYGEVIDIARPSRFGRAVAKLRIGGFGLPPGTRFHAENREWISENAYRETVARRRWRADHGVD